MGMWACFFYNHELCESDLITISVTINTAQRDNPNWKTKNRKQKAMYFLSKNSHGCDNSKYPTSSL